MSDTVRTNASGESENADRGIAPPGFRLPAATRLGVVRLQIANLTRSLAYYERVLGFRTLRRTEGIAVLGTVDGETPIIELHERPGANPHPRRGQLGLFHFAILLPDRASLGRFVSHLSEIGAHAGMSDHLVSEALYLTDPDGLGIEVYADRPRSQWTYDGRELSMSTLPLDVQDLVAAGGTQRWTGMPNGTTMGHVHLHVGDLDEAAAFYHEALGFDKVVWGYPGALFMSAGGYHHHLGTNTWAPAVAPGPDQARLLSWDIELPEASDLEGVLDSLSRSWHTAERTAEGGIVHDPWGTTFRLVPRRTINSTRSL